MNFGSSVFVVIASFIGGILNGFGASGGVVLMSSLLAVGFPPISATAINKLSGSAGSISAFIRSMSVEKIRPSLMMSTACIIGTIIGSLTALHVSNVALGRSFAFLTAAALIATLTKRAVFRPGKASTTSKKRPGITVLSALSGVYNGIFGPGTIILTSSPLQMLLQYTQTESISLAFFLNALSNIMTCIIFVASGKVALDISFVTLGACIASNTLGAYLGSSLAMKGGKLANILSIFAMTFLLLYLITRYWI